MGSSKKRAILRSTGRFPGPGRTIVATAVAIVAAVATVADRRDGRGATTTGAAVSTVADRRAARKGRDEHRSVTQDHVLDRWPPAGALNPPVEKRKFSEIGDFEKKPGRVGNHPSLGIGEKKFRITRKGCDQSRHHPDRTSIRVGV